jgi:outer membrane protein insertion porin family
MDQLQQVYREAGFPLVRVADVGVDGYGTLRLRLVEATIHAIRIVGNTETKEYVIRRELSTRPGAPFDARRFDGDRRRLEALGYFDAVTPRFEPGPTPDEVDLVIEVKEGQTGSIDLGGDYSFQQGMIGRLGVQKDNMLGLGQRVGANVSVSQRLQVSGELTYFNPWLDDAHTSLDGSLYARRYNNFLADFREDRLGASVNATRPLFGTAFETPWIGTAGLRAETVGTYENLFLGGANKPAYANGQKITLSPSGTDAVIAGSFGVTYDTRDLAMNPTEGWFNSLTLEPGVVNLNSPLVRGTGAFNHFIPLFSVPWAPTERTTLAIGTRLGLIMGPQAPAYERFYSTGPYLVRGWPEYATLQSIQSQNLPLNYFQGSNAAVASLEYRFPLYNIVSGVLFGDTGMFWDNSVTDPNGHLLLHSGYGLGLRVNTPIGLVRVDYGLNRLDLGQGQFHFSVGQKF